MLAHSVRYKRIAFEEYFLKETRVQCIMILNLYFTQIFELATTTTT